MVLTMLTDLGLFILSISLTPLTVAAWIFDRVGLPAVADILFWLALNLMPARMFEDYIEKFRASVPVRMQPDAEADMRELRAGSAWEAPLRDARRARRARARAEEEEIARMRHMLECVLGPELDKTDMPTRAALAMELIDHFHVLASTGKQRAEISLEFPNGPAEVILAIGEEALKIRRRREQWARIKEAARKLNELDERAP